MVRDGVLNMVDRLRERGLDPRRIGGDAWEARCPAHRGADHSLAISRNEFNHVVLACRSTENCQHTRIIRALGWTNDHVYAETPDWLISRLRHIPIQPASFHNPSAAEGGPCDGREANGSTGVPTPGGREPGRDAVGASGGGQEARSIQNEFGGQKDLATTDANGSPCAVPSTENVGVAAMIHPESGTESDMVQSGVTPAIVAGVCDPGVPRTTGLREAGYNACPIVARVEKPECYPKTSVFEPCRENRQHAANDRYRNSVLLRRANS